LIVINLDIRTGKKLNNCKNIIIKEIYKVRTMKSTNQKNQRLTKKELRELLINAKRKADKMPKEQGSFRLEVVCMEEDIK
jgi:hypothetical protein